MSGTINWYETYGEVLSRAAKIFEGREESLEDMDEMRIGNVLQLSNAFHCFEASRLIKQAVAGQGAFFNPSYVDDGIINQAARALASDPCTHDVSLTDELQIVIDLSHAAGLSKEVEWMSSYWGITPSSNVTSLTRS